jgi:hypothetical protein
LGVIQQHKQQHKSLNVALNGTLSEIQSFLPPVTAVTSSLCGTEAESQQIRVSKPSFLEAISRVCSSSETFRRITFKQLQRSSERNAGTSVHLSDFKLGARHLSQELAPPELIGAHGPTNDMFEHLCCLAYNAALTFG